MTFGEEGDQQADKGVWMSIWVDDVAVREMHVRHPDGHVFRISRGIEDEE